MRQAPGYILELIEPVIEGLGYECVGIEYSPHPRHGLLRIYIDQEAGINVADCAKVSHQVSGVLAVEDSIRSNYQIEVSSPGSDRPLFKLSHFQRCIGKNVRVKLFKPINNRHKITGEIIAVVDELVSVQETGVVFEIPFKSINKAHLLTEYPIK